MSHRCVDDLGTAASELGDLLPGAAVAETTGGQGSHRSATARRLPDTVHIARGSHAPGDPTTGDPACTMEWTAWLAGEAWSDRPECTHPVIAAAVRAVNDQLDDGPRQQLAELIPALVDTADTRDDPLARRQLSVRLAVWCAEQVLHLVPDVAREACERAIAAARAWADADVGHAYADAVIYAGEAAEAADAALYAADAALYAADAALYAALYAADAAIDAGDAPDSVYYATEAGHAAATAAAIDVDGDPIGLLRGLLAEHTRLRARDRQPHDGPCRYTAFPPSTTPCSA